MGWEFIKQRFGQEQGALVQDLLVQRWDPKNLDRVQEMLMHICMQYKED